MSDFKSKLPNLKELTSMTSKLFTDIKKSVGEIVHNYKENRAQEAENVEKTTVTATKEDGKGEKIVEESVTVTKTPKKAKSDEPVETVETIETTETVETIEPVNETKPEDTKK